MMSVPLPATEYHSQTLHVRIVGNSQFIRSRKKITDSCGQPTWKESYDVKPLGVYRKPCQTWVSSFHCEHCGETYHFPISCHKRTCPACAKEQADDLFFRLRGLIDTLKPVEGFRLRLMTLTRRTTSECWKDLDALRDRVKNTNECVKKLYHKLIEVKGKSGMLSETEFGGKGGVIHVHCLVWSKWVDQKILSAEWKRLTGDSYIVDIREVKGDKSEALREITKYVCNLDKMPQDRKEDIEYVLKGTRRVRTMGIFYNCEALKQKKQELKLKCWRCGEPLSLEYDGKYPMDDLKWAKIIKQATYWEVSIREMEGYARGAPINDW